MRKRTVIILVVVLLAMTVPLFWLFKKEPVDVQHKVEGEDIALGYCGSCHLKPEPGAIPRYYWRDYVLPKMGEYMGIHGPFFDPYAGLDPEEAKILKEAAIYPDEPRIDSAHWAAIVDYYLRNSPDSILSEPGRQNRSREATLFKASKHTIVKTTAASMVTGVKYDSLSRELWVGDGLNNVFIWNKDQGLKRSFSTRSPVIDFDFTPEWKAMTEIGFLFPSDKFQGFMTSPINADSLRVLIPNLQRPVYTQFHDFNDDQVDEVIVCNFGNQTGSFNIYSLSGTRYNSVFEINQPGAIKAVIRDMDKDGRDDIIVLFAQSDESVLILYQTEELKFRTERVLRFPPQHGSSDMVVLDVDDDGYEDIMTVQGDNADYSYFTKPYHGFRIFCNDGDNNFDEVYFAPIYGTTRLQADDFDKDGDHDFAILATFPDYDHLPNENFVYLENKSSGDEFDFAIKTINLPVPTHSVTLEKADIDHDGDKDLIMGAFNISPVPVPSFISKTWNKKGTELLILENQLIH